MEPGRARQLGDEQFVTAILAEVSADGTKIELLSCGHPEPLLLGPARPRFIGLDEGSLPLGLGQLADVPRIPVTIAFEPGDALLLYTDGASDGHNKALSVTAGGSARRPGLALAKPLSRAGQRLERKVSAEPEITAPRAAGRNDHSAHRKALRRPVLDGGTVEGRQDRRGVPVLRQRHLPDPDRTGLQPIGRP